jgi:hypothetical protein
MAKIHILIKRQQSMEALFGKDWYLNKARNSMQFVLHHLPVIACKYVHVWGLELIVDDDHVISQHLLRQIDDQI